MADLRSLENDHVGTVVNSNYATNASDEFTPSDFFFTSAAKSFAWHNTPSTTLGRLTPSKNLHNPTNDFAMQALTQRTFRAKEVSEVFKLRAKPKIDRIIVTHQWEGVVIDLEGNTVCAQIADMRNDEQPDEIIEFSLSEVPKDDRSVIESGSIFYLTITERMTQHGTMHDRKIDIRFRREPVWTPHRIALLKQNGEELFNKVM